MESFRDIVSVKMAEPPWNYNKTMQIALRVRIFVNEVKTRNPKLYLRGNDTLSKEQPCKNNLFPSEKWSTLKGTTWSSLFAFRVDLFSDGDWYANKQEVTTVVSLIENGGKATKCIQYPYVCYYKHSQ